ncbi:hypothetical protein MCP1_400006 [Candidatus Terasakiella magnetica]|nr:hypothetical protein MCP1_400006 [Candidatus Terasakiella magnetica]
MNIFISYRRADSQDLAGRIADRLKSTPEIDTVFIDVESIAPGDDFRDRIRVALSESFVCLVIIGPHWRGEGDAGTPPRIFDAGDLVRQEVREALQNKVKTVPVLANGASMPSPADLPPDLHGLTAINGVALRHSYFEHDFALLNAAIFPTERPTRRLSPLALIARAAFGMIAAAATMVLLLGILNLFTGLSLEEMAGGPGMVVLITVAILTTGAVLPFVLRRGS